MTTDFHAMSDHEVNAHGLKLFDEIGKASHILGLPPGTILGWGLKYGLPVLVQLLPILLSGNFSGLNVSAIIAWALAALSAIKAGQPVPPIPTPTPKTPEQAAAEAGAAEPKPKK